MVAPLIGMLVANVAGKALSGSGEGKEGGLGKLLDPLGLLGGKDEKKESNPIEQLLGMVTGGGGGGLSLLG